MSAVCGPEDRRLRMETYEDHGSPKHSRERLNEELGFRQGRY